MCLITKNARNNAESLCKCISEYLNTYITEQIPERIEYLFQL